MSKELDELLTEALRQSAAGEVVYLGSFAQYADIDIDDEEQES